MRTKQLTTTSNGDGEVGYQLNRFKAQNYQLISERSKVVLLIWFSIVPVFVSVSVVFTFY